MDIYPKYRSAFGYQTGGGGVDSYGVDHSNFSLRDEIKYQTDRVNKENQLKNYYNNQGITKNYPQYGSDFWNVGSKYNYGAVNSTSNNNISSPRQGILSNQKPEPTYWTGRDDGKRVYENMLRYEGNKLPSNFNFVPAEWEALRGVGNIISDYFKIKNYGYSDKYKHAYINCNASQYGKGGEGMAKLLSDSREAYDVASRSNTLDESMGDQYANKIGRFLGRKYPDQDCNELVQRYILKKYPK